MIGGFLWFQGTFAQIFGSIQVLGKENVQPDPFRSEFGRSLKKKNDRNSGLIEAVYEMIDKRAITPVTSVTSLEFYSFFL